MVQTIQSNVDEVLIYIQIMFYISHFQHNTMVLVAKGKKNMLKLCKHFFFSNSGCESYLSSGCDGHHEGWHGRATKVNQSTLRDR